MTTPITRNNIGSPVTVTTANTIANNAYANAADKLRINNTGGAMVADFRLTGLSFGSAPVAGIVQIVAVDRDFAGNAGPTPSSAMVGRVYSGSPSPSAGNASTGWIVSWERIPISADADYWLFNNGTGQQISAGCTLTAQPWSPGA